MKGRKMFFLLARGAADEDGSVCVQFLLSWLDIGLGI